MKTDPTTTAVLAGAAWSRLVTAHADYTADVSEHYDEVLHEVSNRIEAAGSIGKLDIGALLFWKRLRANTPWAAKLLAMSDVEVRRVTTNAVRAVNDSGLPVEESAQRGRSVLSALPGFKTGDAMASALLTAAAPTRMAVYDRRAREGLRQLDIDVSNSPGRYARYMRIVDELATHAREQHQEWTARDVDTALFWLGRPAT